MKIGYQGSVGAFSYIAAKELYPNCDLQNFKTFNEVVEAVLSGEISYGVIPLENSYAGRVFDVYNIFSKVKFYIVKEKLIQVSHCLCSIHNSEIKDITYIFSHEQALKQCSLNISKEIRNAKLIQKENTAIAAQFVSNEKNKNYAAICSKEAANNYNLKILKENFQDSENNFTLFIAVSKEMENLYDKNLNYLTSLLFEINNKSGSLYNALGSFAKNDISITKLESYIANAIASKNASFFITVEGNILDKKISNSIENLKKHTNNVHIFGSYLKNR